MTDHRYIDKASPSNFTIVFPKLPISDGIDTRPLTLNIQNTILPSVTLTDQELPWFAGTHRVPSGEITFDPWNIEFQVDRDFYNWRLLFKWVMAINNGRNTTGSPKFTDYVTDASYNITDNFNESIMEINFVNIFPTNIGEIQFDQREGETYLTGTCAFAYTYYEIREKI